MAHHRPRGGLLRGLDAEVEGPAAGTGESEVAAEYPDEVDRAEYPVAHAVAGLQRIEVGRLHVRDQAAESAPAVFQQRPRHADRVQPLAAVARAGEAFVHV